MKFLLSLALYTVVISCNQKSPLDQIDPKPLTENLETQRPKNIILVIGDGTGINQISSLEFYKEGVINYERFPVIGLSKVSSTSKITDSGAAATAIASGQKTYNKAIGVDADGEPIANIVEFASGREMATGVISTSSITHATPACFYAHNIDRNNYEMIAQDLTTSSLTYFAGSGLQYFTQRSDQNNLTDSLKAAGFTIDTTALNSYPEATRLGYLIGNKDLPAMSEGRGNFLIDAADKGLALLQQSDQGFFLMVEGSQVDYGGHDNSFDYMISELIDLDNTIGRLLDYAIADQETLIIVTGDHATGGLALTAKDGDYDVIEPKFSTGNHTGDWIPVFAYGPGAEQFSGVYENTALYHKMILLLDASNAPYK